MKRLLIALLSIATFAQVVADKCVSIRWMSVCRSMNIAQAEKAGHIKNKPMFRSCPAGTKQMTDARLKQFYSLQC